MTTENGTSKPTKKELSAALKAVMSVQADIERLEAEAEELRAQQQESLRVLRAGVGTSPFTDSKGVLYRVAATPGKRAEGDEGPSPIKLMKVAAIAI